MVLLPKRLKARVLERHERTTKTTVNDGSKGLGFGVLMSQKKETLNDGSKDSRVLGVLMSLPPGNRPRPQEPAQHVFGMHLGIRKPTALRVMPSNERVITIL